MAIKQEAINGSAAASFHAAGVGGAGGKRFAARRKCNIPATAALPDQSISVACRIVDMSAAGAGIIVSSSRHSQGLTRQTLPASFWLCLAHDGSQVRCRIVWRAQDSYGVEFVSPMQQVARPRGAKRLGTGQPVKKKSAFGLGKFWG